MEKYIVEVDSIGIIWKNEKDQFHRLGGLPAVEYADGSKLYYENGKQLTAKEAEEKRNPHPTCEGKVVEIEGKKYKLTLF